jgi:uncharacterized protein YjbJ (UPF0337 family)
MKEVAGAITGDEDKKAEGQAQQRAAAAAQEAAQKERTRQEQAKAKEAGKERDGQERKDKGLTRRRRRYLVGALRRLHQPAGAPRSPGPFSCPSSPSCLEERLSVLRRKNKALVPPVRGSRCRAPGGAQPAPVA